MKVNSGQAPSTLIPKYIGTDFDKVITVVDNIDYIKDVAEGIAGLPVVSYIGETPPEQPLAGSEWYCTTDGRTYVWYEDGDSSQWVESSPQSTVEEDLNNLANIFALWKRSVAEAGYELIGSFGSTHTIDVATKVLLDKVQSKVFKWTGDLPKTVAEDEKPEGIEWQAVDSLLSTNLGEASGSSLIGFTQSGEDSIKRSVEDKLRENVTPLDKGAVGDGLTNDTTAFQKLDTESSGKYIDLLGKTYLVDSLPTGCFYFNGVFKVGSEVISVTIPRSLSNSVEVTVGASGDFQTINEALEYLTNHYYKPYKQGLTTPSPTYGADKVSAVIRLLAGFVMQEQVILRQTKLGWITIIADDPTVTISRESLTKIAYFEGTASEMYPAFYAGDNSELPIIACKFDMDTSGVATNRHFMVVNRNSSGHVWPYAGCTNAGGHGIYAREGSNISCRLAVCDGAGDSAFIAANGARISAQGASGKNSKNGVTATDCSQINFAGGVADHCTQYGINCIEGSSVNCSSANVTFATTAGIRASNCDKVSAFKADVSDSGMGVDANQGSTVAIKEGKADRCGTGIRADGASSVDFENGSATDCTSRGIQALGASRVNAIAATLTGAGLNGVLANLGSTIIANGANCRKGSVDANSDIAVGNGSIISAATATGGTTVTPNTLSRDGFITV